MKRTVLATFVGSALLLAALLPTAVVAKAPATGPFHTDGIYIVQMTDMPVVAYTGGTKRLKATAPKPGTKINPAAGKVVKYVDYLTRRHNRMLRKVGGATKLYDYVYTYNGFAARLTASQANKLTGLKAVLSVSPDETRVADTSWTPQFLGLTAPGGLWDQLGGTSMAGEGIIIGDIDSGIWPESLSFADRVDKKTGLPSDAPTAKLVYQQIPGWHGKCIPGEAFTASDCNQKLIGAQYFNAGYGGNAGINADMPWEFASARDYNGHGTHTASTAGGNYNVPTTGPAAAFGPISGMAPRARIAMYKALWSTEDGSQASGYTSDLVAAIDTAVSDGVDVINYSISGTSTNFRDPVEISFLYAADAGIFVAESAGNSGPTAGTVAHPSPWTTTVAAGTHSRATEGSVTLGNGSTYVGASVATAVGPAPLINSTDAGLPEANPDFVRLCYSTIDTGGTPVLDPAKVAGKIVVCERGATARVNKSLAVKEAGGVGTILINTSPNSLNADFHSVPTVHLPDTDLAPVEAYAATPDATATINAATITYDAPAPYTAAFSSRGPLAAGDGDLLKPDVIAPGQDIIASVAPPANQGLDFNIYSGTSMSSPHVAGVAALLMDLHPNWSPMAVKSALMTSAYDVLDGPDTDPSVIFSQGAGHIAPTNAADPGLVFDSNIVDWYGFLCGTQLPTAYCTDLWQIPVISPSNFNGASIAIGSLPGSTTVTRTVTNVGATGTYSFSFTGVGIDASVSPATFTLGHGQSQELEITINRTDGALNEYSGGQLTWSDGTHDVRIPVVARPVAIAAPAEVSGSYDVTFGYSGDFSATARGLVPAVTFDGSINTGDQLVYEVPIPDGTTYARFSLFDENVSPASDLDLYVFDPAGHQIGVSGGPTAAEEVDLHDPAAGTYYALVYGYATADPSTFTLFTWALGSSAAGNMTVTAPTSAVFGSTGSIELSFSGLTAGTKYLGSVVYGGAAGMPDPTIVRVDP